jgi:hypothetical protein
VGEGLAFDAAWLFAALLALIVIVAAVLATRRFWLERGGGTVECGLRRLPGRGPWRLGVASYGSDELRWHGALGVALRPEYVFRRRALEVTSRRLPSQAECTVLSPDWVVIEAKAGPPEDLVELAMTEQALTGFLAWLEAAPPGSHLEDL